MQWSQSKPQQQRAISDVLMDAAVGEPGQRRRRLGDDDLRLGPGRSALQDTIGDGEKLITRAQLGAHAGRTATLRKRHGAAPWPTCVTCPG